MSTKSAILTIVSNNYIHFARTLMESVKVHEPGNDRYVLVVDDPVASEARDDSHLYSLITLDQLDLPAPSQFLFRYNVLEANTAVKPWSLEYLSGTLGYDSVIYLDPDIYLYRPLSHVHQRLRSGAALVLTPHVTNPLWDGEHPNELDILKAGAYNLGFAAIGKWSAAEPLISWWQHRLEHHCVVDPEQGLFVDQRWMDLAPGLFEDVHILRHRGYNVAYWNIHERPLREDGNGWFAGPELLHFFHFSGIDLERPDQFSKHQTRFRLNDLGAGKRLFLDYCARLRENGANTFKGRDYGFSATRAGVRIPDIVRRLYRKDKEFQRLCGDDPFSADLVSHLNAVPRDNGIVPGLTRLMSWIWQDREELREAYPVPEGPDGLAFTHWYASQAGTYLGVADALIEPARRQLASVGMKSAEHDSPGFLRSLGTLLTMDDSLFLHGAYRLMLNRQADSDGRAHYMERLRRKRLSRRGLLLRLALSPEGRRKGHSLPQLAAVLLPTSLLRLLADPGPTEFPRGSGEDPPRGVECQRRGSTRAGRARTGIAAVDPDGLTVAGYFHMDTGVGESARRCVAAARSLNLEVEQWQVDPAGTMTLRSERMANASSGHRAPATLLHINADQLLVLGDHLDEIDSGSTYRIGYWHWEMPLFPAKYTAAFQYVDEIWVPSSYIVESLLPVSPVPVVKIPHSIEVPAEAENPVMDARRLDDGVFSFLVMYDMRSYEKRKNPIGAIEAYLKAFPEPGSHALVVKVSNANLDPPSFQRLLDLARKRPDILVLDGVMDRRTVYALEAQTDCLVSLHRSEGFGLCPAECMYLGKPVIATGWSGNMEFMDAANSYLVEYSLHRLTERVGPYDVDQYWAEPDLEHAASLMRRVYSDQAGREERGREAARTMRERFSPVAIGKRYRERLSVLSRASQ